MPAARVLFDIVSYRAEEGHMDSAVKDEVVDLTSSEFKRLKELGAVEADSAKPAATEKAVADMNLKELKAFAAENDLDVDTKLKRDDLAAAVEKAQADKAGATGAVDTPPQVSTELRVKAESLGIEIPEDATVEDIVALIEAHKPGDPT